MEVPDANGNEVELPSVVQCPECEHEIAVEADWSEGDVFSCPNCAIGLQVTNLEPVWLDFAPETKDWSDDDDSLDSLTLDEVEELEDQEDVDDNGVWTEPVSRRVANLRPSRSRSLARKDPAGAAEDHVTYLTPEGAARLQRELEHLQTVRFPKVAAWLSDALSEGFEDEDVTELEEARSELSLVEGRIRSIQSILATAEYLPEPETTDEVQLGNRVTVIESDQEPESYRIVSPAEADPLSGYISHVSPLGRALIGHKVGDLVVVNTPDGPIEFRIVEIG